MTETRMIAGLGNPGPQYAQTRHNVGFMVIEALAAQAGITGKGETKFQAIVGSGRINNQKTLLVQPTTFMNLSGQAVQAVMQYQKIPPEQILIIYDDIDLPFGKIRFRAQGGPGTHNGMKSIINCLNSKQFARLRVGVGAPPAQWDLADYVLACFSPEEQRQLPEFVSLCFKAAIDWLGHGTTYSMDHYNGLLG